MKNKMTLDGGIFLVTKIRLVGDKTYLQEYKRAKKVRSDILRILRSVASIQTPLGYMAPHSAQSALDLAIDGARLRVIGFNSAAEGIQMVYQIDQLVVLASRNHNAGGRP